MSRVNGLSAEETERFWAHVEKNAKEVESWPEWKKGGISIVSPEASSEKQASHPTEGTGETRR
jgi:hypothetical protein